MSSASQPAPAVRHLDATEVADFVRDALLSQHRDHPIVALTTCRHTGCTLLEPHAIARELRGHAEVVVFETGDATWALSESLPPRLDVYGGAARIWWPGLNRVSDPYEHPLFFVFSQPDADRVFAQVVSAVRGSEVPGTHDPAVEPPGTPESATVTAVSPGRIEIASVARCGTVEEAELPLDLLASCLAKGCTLDARPLRRHADGTWAFSLVGLLPNAWKRFADEVQVGDVLIGRVQNVLRAKNLVFVDILPGVVGVCHISELDYHRVHDMEDFVPPGELLSFRVMRMDPKNMRLQLSLRRAYGQEPRPSPSLVAGGQPFVWKEGMPMFESLRIAQQRDDGEDAQVRILADRAAGSRAPAPDASEQIASLIAELRAATEERTSLVGQVRELRQQNQQLKKEVRASEDRHDALQKKLAYDLDPVSSKRAFLLAVRVCHARTFDEHDRLEHPLRRMRVGSSFLDSLRELDGVDVSKVVEVCTQVAAGVAHKMPGREVHQLRSGSRGAGGHTRASDNAKAWRCSLQDNTAAARRLHWWSIPGQDGGIVEFASVGVHDDLSIPE